MDMNDEEFEVSIMGRALDILDPGRLGAVVPNPSASRTYVDIDVAKRELGLLAAGDTIYASISRVMSYCDRHKVLSGGAQRYWFWVALDIVEAIYGPQEHAYSDPTIDNTAAP